MLMSPCRLLIATMLAVAASGCVSVSQTDGWGSNARWPDGPGLKQAAIRAASDAHTWVPLAGAVLLTIGNADDSASAWLADEAPLFGDNAGDTSDLLADLSMAAYLVTALAAPSASLSDKTGGLAVGVGAMALNRGVTGSLKSLVGRRRPNGRDDRSFPSGHASGASASATLAVANLDWWLAPGWLNSGLSFGFYGLAGGAALARVEAGEHHLTDVLAGYGLGHFIAEFVQQAFLETRPGTVSVTFRGADRGGVLVFEVPLGAVR